MLNVNFNLRKRKSKNAEVIYLVLRWSGDYYRYTTKFKVLPKNWDRQKQRVKAVITETLKDVINKHLGEIETAVKKLYADAIADRICVSKEYFKNGLDKWTGRIVEEKPNFWNFINNYIETSKTRIDPRTGRTISKRTIQEYNTTKNLLIEFEAENRETIDFDNISLYTLIDFRDFLTTVKRYKVKDKKTGEIKEEPYKLNNIAKHIDNLRQFLRAAASEKIAFDTDVLDNKKFKPARENAHNVYLNEDELLAIAALDLSNSLRLDKARDIFLIGCFTGQRVSDYNNIKPHHIKGRNIELFQAKTGEPVVIPIHPTVKGIFTKYGGITPPKISDQKLNEYVKEVCQLAGIKEIIEKQRTKGGLRSVDPLKKWEMVSSHTARRSFATNMVKRGIPIQTIMKITGHTKESTFLKYVKLSAVEHADIMRQHFNKN
jgi:integrase